MQEPEQDLTEAHTSGISGLDDVLRPKRSRRTTLLRFGATALVLVAAVALMLHLVTPGFLAFPAFGKGSSQAPGRTTTGNVSITLSGTPGQGQPMLQAITLQTNVSFGLSLNSQPLTQNSSGNTIPVLKGKNTLAFNAPPFLPLSCSFIWPFSENQGGSGPCSLAGFGDNGTGQVAVVNFAIPLQNIPTALRQNLNELVRQQISQAAAGLSVAIPVGDDIPYSVDANGIPQSRPTTQPLVGHVSISPQSTPDTSCDDILCPGQVSAITGQSEKIFSFIIHFQLGWRFTDATSQEVDAVTIGDGHNYRALLIGTHFDASGGWQLLSSSFGGDTTFAQNVQQQIIAHQCEIANDELTAIMRASNNNQGFGGNSQGESIQGCSIHIQSDSTDYGTFISRFGALLTVDAAAHKLAPSLPIAPPDEVAAVAAG